MMIFMFELATIVDAYSVPWTSSRHSLLKYHPHYHHRTIDIYCPSSMNNIRTHRSHSGMLMTKLHQTKKDDEGDGNTDINNSDNNNGFIQTFIKKIADLKPIMFIDQKTFVNLSVGAVTGIIFSLTAVLWVFYSDDLTSTILPSLAYSSSTVDQTTNSQETKVWGKEN